MKSLINTSKFSLIRRFSLIIVIVCPCYYSYAQDTIKTNRSWIKFGIDYGISYINPHELNSVIGNWLTSTETNIDISILKGIHLGLSGTAYTSITLFKFFEIRPQYGYSYSPYIMLNGEGGLLRANITYETLGISSNILFGSFRVGGGINEYYSRINWKDDYYKYHDTWKGNTLGYNLFVGIDRNRSKHRGRTYTLLYKNAIVDKSTNRNKHTVKDTGDNKDLALNLSGFEFKIGFYFGW